jgi:hypothetical protein
MVPKLELPIIESSDSILGIAYFLEEPELINFAVAWPLYYFIMMLKSFLEDV